MYTDIPLSPKNILFFPLYRARKAPRMKVSAFPYKCHFLPNIPSSHQNSYLRRKCIIRTSTKKTEPYALTLSILTANRGVLLSGQPMSYESYILPCQSHPWSHPLMRPRALSTERTKIRGKKMLWPLCENMVRSPGFPARVNQAGVNDGSMLVRPLRTWPKPNSHSGFCSISLSPFSYAHN